MLSWKLGILAVCAVASANVCAREDPLSAGAATHHYGWDEPWEAKLTLGDDRLRESPIWPPEAADPPRSARQAMKAAWAAIPRELGGEPIDWKLRSVALTFARLQSDETKVRWYWLVTFENKGDGTIMRILPVAVTMDGKAIAATISRRAPSEDKENKKER